MDLPIDSMVIFHSFLYVYQRVHLDTPWYSQFQGPNSRIDPIQTPGGWELWKQIRGTGIFGPTELMGFTNYKSRDFPANMGFKTINFCGTILPAILLFVGIRWYWSTLAVLRTTDGLVLFWWCQQGLGIVNILCAEVVVSNLGNHKKRCGLV